MNTRLVGPYPGSQSRVRKREDGRAMSSYDIAEQIREFLPGTEEILVQYLSGYLVDEASEDEDILQVARYMLESIAMDKPDVLEKLMTTLSALLQDQLTQRENTQSGPKLQRLDKVLDMSKASAMSNTIAFSEGVDLESINKGKCVNDACPLQAICLMHYVFEGYLALMSRSLKSKRRSSKRKSRNERGGTCMKAQSCWSRKRKRSARDFFSYFLQILNTWSQAILRRDVHEGSLGYMLSRLSFMAEQINPLQFSAASKNKSKDIHLPSIDVSFGSNRILFVLIIASI